MTWSVSYCRIPLQGDFGIAKVLGSQQDMAATLVGTPHSLSPELVQGQPYDQKSDVWALGCVLYELCALHKPFDASNLPAIIFSIMRNRPRPVPEAYSPALRALVAALLDSNPAKRPSLPEIEAMPTVQAHITAWRDAYNALEVQAGMTPTNIAPVSAAAAAAGLATSRLRTASVSGGGMLAAVGSGGGEDGSGAGGVGSPTPRVWGDGAGGSALPVSPGVVFAGLASPKAARQAAVAFEREALRDIDDIAAEAESAGGASAAAASLQARIESVQGRLEAGPAVSGRVWEGLGRAWADCGQFSRAIQAYRRSLRAKSANASLVAMEQLGNLLVRRAQQVWAQARRGDPDGALQAAEEALAGGSGASASGGGGGGGALLQRITAKQARRGKAAAKAHRGGVVSLADVTSAASARGEPAVVPSPAEPAAAGAGAAATTGGGRAAAEAASGAAAAATAEVAVAAAGAAEDTADTEAEEEEPAWQRAASALMYEGLAYIERMCSLGSTAERRALLGSAYKRRAWTGLGDSRKEDLVQAAANYATAHEVEMEEGKEHPSPYARLNQLTLEMLAGSGTEREKEA